MLCLEANSNALEHLNTVALDVFFPILTNLKNQEGWPEVIAKDVVHNYHRFVANMTVTIGQINGRTLLPMPPIDASTGEALGKDKDKVHVLESAVVIWTRQIKNVLKLDAEAALKSLKNPGPMVELEFWHTKAQSLNSIFEQLKNSRLIKVMKVLEGHNYIGHKYMTHQCYEGARSD